MWVCVDISIPPSRYPYEQEVSSKFVAFFVIFRGFAIFQPMIFLRDYWGFVIIIVIFPDTKGKALRFPPHFSNLGGKTTYHELWQSAKKKGTRKREMEKNRLSTLSSPLSLSLSLSRDLYIPWAFRLFGLFTFERQTEQQPTLQNQKEKKACVFRLLS